MDVSCYDLSGKERTGRLLGEGLGQDQFHKIRSIYSARHLGLGGGTSGVDIYARQRAISSVSTDGAKFTE